MRVAVAGMFFVGAVTSRAEQTNEIARLKQQVIRFQNESKWVEALPLAEKLVTLTTNQHGENSVDTADALHRWAWLVQENGDYDKAEQIWLRALSIDEALFGKDAVETTRRLHMLGGLYRDRGDYEKAVPLLQKALGIREKHWGRNHPETGQIVHSLGRHALLAGDLADAEAKLLRALRIFEQSGPSNQENITATLSALGWTYAHMGDYSKAQAMMHRSMEIRRQLYGLDHVYMAGGLSDLAMVYRARGEFDKAESLFQQELVMLQNRFGTNHVSLGGTLNELGAIYLSAGKLAKAEPVLQQARAILEKNLGAAHPRVAEVLTVLSRLYETRGNYQTAHDLCSRALAIREKHLGASHFQTLTSLRQQAHLEIVLGRPDRALAAADRLQEGEERLLENILSFTSERQRLAYQRDSFLFQGHAKPWADLGAVQPLARTILRTKGVVLDSLLEDHLLEEANDKPEVRQLVSQITDLRRQLAQLTPTSAGAARPTTASTEMESIAQQVESMEGSQARRVAGLGHARRALSVTAEQVRSAIPEGTVLLEMLRYKHYIANGRWQANYGVLILTCNKEPRWVRLGPADTIEKSIKLHQHAVRSPDASEALVHVLHDLHDSLWTPILRVLPARTKQVIVSPDGELNFVSFAALLTPENRFLGEEFLFSYVACGRDLLAADKPAPATSQLLVWANPAFGTAALDITAAPNEGSFTRSRGMRGLSFRPLPGSQEEGETLRDCARKLGFDEAVLYVGTNATEAELHRVRSPKALHLATHGFVLPQIAAAADEESFRAWGSESVLPRMNPMLRSGLALAGAQLTLRAWSEGKDVPADNDGIVTADEIGGINLHGTWLVVLSACDTGAGEAQAGEGVLGLRRGFVQAGAQNLLLTLWPIDDQHAAGLIPDFYAELAKTGSPPRSLARVQRAWLQKLRVEKGIAAACRVAGPFILSFQGRPD